MPHTHKLDPFDIEIAQLTQQLPVSGQSGQQIRTEEFDVNMAFENEGVKENRSIDGADIPLYKESDTYDSRTTVMIE